MIAEKCRGAEMKERLAGKFVLGVTGGVGSGKSAVLTLLRERHGAEVIEADRVAEELYLPGSKTHEAVAELLGASVVREDGSLDRKAIADRIFAEPELRFRLNGIVHPATLREVKRRIEGSPARLVVYEAALPREAHFDELCDALLYVRVSREERTRRLMAGRGYSREKCEAIMAGQLSDESFLAMADAVLNNEGSLGKTAEALEVVLKDLMKRGK